MRMAGVLSIELAMSYRKQGGSRAVKTCSSRNLDGREGWNTSVESVADLYHCCRDAVTLRNFVPYTLTDNPRIADHRIRDGTSRVGNTIVVKGCWTVRRIVLHYSVESLLQSLGNDSGMTEHTTNMTGVPRVCSSHDIRRHEHVVHKIPVLDTL